MKRTKTDAGTQFTSKEFWEVISVDIVIISWAESDHQEMNGQVEVPWQTFWAIAHPIIVHALVYAWYIDFSLIYTIDNIFSVLPIKNLVNQDGEPTMAHKLAIGPN